MAETYCKLFHLEKQSKLLKNLVDYFTENGITFRNPGTGHAYIWNNEGNRELVDPVWINSVPNDLVDCGLQLWISSDVDVFLVLGKVNELQTIQFYFDGLHDKDRSIVECLLLHAISSNLLKSTEVFILDNSPNCIDWDTVVGLGFNNPTPIPIPKVLVIRSIFMTDSLRANIKGNVYKKNERLFLSGYKGAPR